MRICGCFFRDQISDRGPHFFGAGPKPPNRTKCSSSCDLSPAKGDRIKLHKKPQRSLDSFANRCVVRQVISRNRGKGSLRISHFEAKGREQFHCLRHSCGLKQPPPFLIVLMTLLSARFCTLGGGRPRSRRTFHHVTGAPGPSPLGTGDGRHTRHRLRAHIWSILAVHEG